MTMELADLAEFVVPRLGAATLQSIMLAAAVWALCRHVPRLGAAAHCWLWWLVPLQLLLALIWPMPLALELLPASGALPMSGLPLDLFPSVSQPEFGRTGAAAPPAEAFAGWTSALLLLWLAGVAAMVLRTAWGCRLAFRLRAQARPCEPSAMLDDYRKIGAALGLRRLPGLRVSGSIDSPQLVGALRPLILIPQAEAATLARDEMDMVLRHELMHWMRRDLWWGWLPALAQHAFFFNPVAHLAMREYALAREAACDAAVLSAHRHAPQDYGRLLLRLGVAARPCAGLAGASPTFRMLKRRLAMLRHAAAPSHAGMLGLSIAVASLGVVPYRVVARTTVAPATAAPLDVTAQRLAAATPIAEATRPTGDTEQPDAHARAAGGTPSASTSGADADPRALREGREELARLAQWQAELQTAQTRFDAEQRDAQALFLAEQQAAQARFQQELRAARIRFDDEMRAAQAEQQAQREAQRADYEARRAQEQADEEARAGTPARGDLAPPAADVSTDISGA